MRTLGLAAALCVSLLTVQQSVAKTDTDLAGTWKYTPVPNGPPRANIGNDVTIQKNGETWTLQLAYTTNVLTLLKCAGDGSACTVEKDGRTNFACTSAWETQKLVVPCNWGTQLGQNTVTFAFGRTGPNLTIDVSLKDGSTRTYSYTRI